MTDQTVYDAVMRILDSEENMSQHSRRAFWANQIILMVREDEQEKAVSRVRQNAGYLKTDEMFDVLSAIRDEVGE